jgi:phosphonate transport system substrate-binding protein
MRRKLLLILWLGLLTAIASSCKREAPTEVRLVVSAIPDQDPEKLQRLYGSLADYLSKALNVSVLYKPVSDYKAAVTAFKVGDLDLVWFGGVTGVQARIQVPEARAIVQRDIDEKFRSVFIANTATGIKSLSDLKGRTFTFGSESSTSGRVMPQSFLEEAGIKLGDFKGNPGFSGSHDKTIALVEAGAFDAGVLNEQVWSTRLAEKSLDTSRVAVFWTTPTYHDYHWVLHPAVAKRFGPDFESRLVAALTKLSPEDSEQAKILELFGARKFVETDNASYSEIERVGRSVGLIRLEVADGR